MITISVRHTRMVARALWNTGRTMDWVWMAVRVPQHDPAHAACLPHLVQTQDKRLWMNCQLVWPRAAWLRR